MPAFDLENFDREKPAHVAAAVRLWNAACGADLAITERGMRFNAQPVGGGEVAAGFGLVDGQPAGFVLASLASYIRPVESGASAGQPVQGYVEALAVAPAYRRRGLGSALLAWAEDWLASRACPRFSLGGGLRPFAPGLPVELGSRVFFAVRGYTNRRDFTWDLAADLAQYRPPAAPTMTAAAVRPAQPGDRPYLRAFFLREFPGRWRFEYEESFRHGSRIGDYMVLLTSQGIDGFAHLTFEDSYWPLDRVFPHRLPRPWAQLGPLGVSAAVRGQGLGAALMHGALSHLADQGVRGCVIDWTDKLDFYARFGFEPYRKYVMLAKAKD